MDRLNEPILILRGDWRTRGGIGGAQRFDDRLGRRQQARQLPRWLAHCVGEEAAGPVHAIQNA